MARVDLTEPVKGLTFIDSKGNRHEGVSLPRHLMEPNVSVKARERHLIATNQIPDPSAPPAPDPVEVVIAEVKTDQVAAASEAVAQLQAQLAEIQSNLQGQPLSHAELVSAREEITGFLLKAADAAAQLVQVEGRGSQLKAELTAIATPLNEQAAETARQQAENAEVTTRVLSDLQAQSAAALEALAAEGAAALSEVDVNAERAAKATARTVARDVAIAEAARWAGAGTTIVDNDPLKTDAQSIGQMAFGRPLVPGDCVLHPGEDALRFYRWNGDGWDKRAGEIINRVDVRDVKISAMDNSSKTTIQQTHPTQIIFKGGGEGGEGGMKLLRGTVVNSWQLTAEAYSRGDLPLPTDPDELKAARHELIGDLRGVHFHLLVTNATGASRFVSGTIFLEAMGLENICYYDDRDSNGGDAFDLEVSLVRLADVAVDATDYFAGGFAGRWEFRTRIVENRATAGPFNLSGRIVPLREKP